MKKFRILALILFVMILATACKKSSQEDTYHGDETFVDVTGTQVQEEVGSTEATATEQVSYPLTIKDKFGKDIVIEKEPVSVISFSPELVEIMFAINAGDKIVGRSLYCDYPAETAQIPDMGDLFNLNIESIVEANPDLVLLSSMVSEEIVNSLTSQGIKVLVLDADTDVDGVYTYIQALGQVFNRVQEAEQLAVGMKDEIAQIQAKFEGLDKPTAYFVIGLGEYDSAATGDTFIGQLMEVAGSVNTAADGSNWMYSVEQLVEKDPQILICSQFWDTKATILAEEGYKDLTAVKENRLYEVDENIFYRQGPRMVEAIKVLAEIFHPEVF